MDGEYCERIKRKLNRELGSVITGALSDPNVIEIMLNPDGNLWVERLGHEMAQAGKMTPSSAEALMATIATSLHTTITRENPVLEGELPVDGSRFEGMIPPVVSRPAFSIRKKASSLFTFDDYVVQGIMAESQCSVLQQAVKECKNILVVGGTGSGKTTLTNAIIDQIVKLTPQHRLVIIEDTAEIQCAAKNAVILRATDSVCMQRLLKATMRLRPDRILVGEVRGGEALSLLKGWNTGHPGGVATIHANNAYAGLTRLEQLIGEVTETPMQTLIAEAVDIVVAMEKRENGRRISEIVAVKGFEKETYKVKPL